jgi:hypothetical protein
MEPANTKIDLAKMNNLEMVVRQLMKNPSKQDKICEWADPGLREKTTIEGSVDTGKVTINFRVVGPAPEASGDGN